jgi:lysophospholipase L1-like esterase
MFARRVRPLCSSALAFLVAVLVLAVSTPTSAATTAGLKAYYLALGDSLAYGYQPDGDIVHGYADDFYTDLQAQGTRSLTNLACPGETSGTFIHGGCPYWWSRKTLYTGSQLNAALAFLASHRGRVSPVTIDIGANDVLAAFDPSTCTVGSNWPTVLSTFDSNFSFILGQLHSALKGQGDLIAMNYYDPYQNQCASNPEVLSLLQTFNAHIASDAAADNVPVADVFTSFGGATTPNPNTCSYTWMCSVFNDIHATDQGYAVMASTFEATVGY